LSEWIQDWNNFEVRFERDVGSSFPSLYRLGKMTSIARRTSNTEVSNPYLPYCSPLASSLISCPLYFHSPSQRHDFSLLNSVTLLASLFNSSSINYR